MADKQTKITRIYEIGKIFTPGAPINSLDLFAGRREQLIQVINTVGQVGQHVVLYGERGVGKTSLALVISQMFEKRNTAKLRSARINCSVEDTFASVWRLIFKRLGIQADPDSDVTPETIVDALETVEGKTIIVVDELDRLQNNDALSLIADTIKVLSDQSIPVTMVLVGVADSIDDLVGDHRSIERAMVQVKMPRMSTPELAEIVDKGMARLKMQIEPAARASITQLSEGLPHYAHLLSRDAAQAAVEDDRDSVTTGDVERATRAAVDKAQQSIRDAYMKATRSIHSDSLFAEVLLACALAPKLDDGCFTASAVKRPMAVIKKRPYEIPAFARHLKEFSDAARGNVLQKLGQPHRYVYRFQDPMLQAFVIMHGIAKNLITEAEVRLLRSGGGTAKEGNLPLG